MYKHILYIGYIFLIYMLAFRPGISRILGFKPFVTSASDVAIITISPRCSQSHQDLILKFFATYSYTLTTACSEM